MKKAMIIIAAVLAMAGIVCGCVFWYRSATAGLWQTQEEVKPTDVLERPEPTSAPTVIPSMEPTATPTVTPSVKLTTIPTPTPEPTDMPAAEEPIFTLENYPKVDASLAIHPLVDSIAANFLGMKESELDFTYTTTRSSEVYRNLIDGKVDVIFAAEISEEDKEYAKQQGVELTIIPTTSSAFVFIVNTKNPVDGLTFEQIQKIYTGEITNWSEVGGTDEDIIAYQRPTGSGSQTAMLSLVMKENEIMVPPVHQVQGEMGALVDAIAEYDNAENAIGYSYFYYVNTMYKRDTIKMLAVDGVTPSIETIKSGAYPIYTNGFIVYRSEEPEDGNVKKWVATVLSERGSRIIEEAGYVPVK